MEEKPKSSTAHALNYGLLTGAAMIIFSLILYITGLYMDRFLNYISYLILIAGMVYGTLVFRKQSLSGFMSYGKAFSTCFLIALFASILAAIYTYIFAAFIHPGFSMEVLEKSREQMLSSSQQMSEEQIEQALSWTEKFTTPVMLAVWGLIIMVAISAIVSLVAAIFLKKEDKSLNSVM